MDKFELRKKQLHREIASIEATQSARIIEKFWPIIKRKYEGRFFKIKNRYSGNKYWWAYFKVVEIKPEDVYDTNNGITARYSGWRFETTIDNIININTFDRGYIHGLGKEIDEKEFNEAYNKMIAQLDKLP